MKRIEVAPVPVICKHCNQLVADYDAHFPFCPKIMVYFGPGDPCAAPADYREKPDPEIRRRNTNARWNARHHAKLERKRRGLSAGAARRAGA